jgi:HlyD family secretion protein
MMFRLTVQPTVEWSCVQKPLWALQQAALDSPIRLLPSGSFDATHCLEISTMKTLLAITISVGLAVLAVVVYLSRVTPKPSESLQTAKVERGDLTHTIRVDGTVKLEEVEVGAQVTGMVAGFEPDPDNPMRAVDCGSRVRQGMVLARIDPTVYKAHVNCSEASLRKAKANLSQSQARLEQTQQEWKRAEGLYAVKAIADSDYESAKTDHRMAVANVAVWEAAVQEAEASLCIAKTNLDQTVIRSPCDGVIVDRRVNVGQTVVAAFNVPALFLIAKDSEQVQVWASVNETDIGYIRPGLPVRFTVNACADETFEGRVSQIRLSPVKQPNATLYTVVVSADHFANLMPEMTAKLQFEVERHANVLLIPNSALQGTQMTAIQTTAPVSIDSSLVKGKESSAERMAKARMAAQLRKERWVNRRLWVKDGGLVRPIEVQAGASNGWVTEIAGGGLHEGMEVVLCMEKTR